MSLEDEIDAFKRDENSLQGQARCRICFMESRPLLELCQCAGSIGYVHEECILDWIYLRMVQENAPLIPSCEICHTPYSGQLSNNRRLCLPMLRLKLSLLRQVEKWLTMYFLLGALFCLYLISKVLLQVFWVVGTWMRGEEGTEFTRQLREKPIELIFTHVGLSCFFLQEALVFLRKLVKLVKESYIHVIQFTIKPKRILS